MHAYKIKEAKGFRWFLRAGQFGIGFEVSRGWHGFIATWAYGGQEHFLKWCLAFPGLRPSPSRPRDSYKGEPRLRFLRWRRRDLRHRLIQLRS